MSPYFTQTILGIFTQTPIWVWPLFIALLVLGLRARRTRAVPVMAFYALPFLGISAVTAVSGIGAGAWIWGVFEVAYSLGVWVGYLLQQRWVLDRTGGKVRLAGESLTLTMMMLVFGANFVSGVLEAVSPQVYSSAVFHVIFAAALGLSSGSFAGRALRVWKAV